MTRTADGETMMTWEVLAVSAWAAACAIGEYGLQDAPPCVKQYIFASAFVRSSLAVALLMRGLT